MTGRLQSHRAVVTVGLAVGLAVGLGLTGCSSGQEARRAAGSAIWLGSSTELVAEDATALAQVSVKELFVESARLSWSGGKPSLETLPLQDFPRRSLVTLVIRGPFDPGADTDVAVASLVAALRELRLDREGQGVIPRGLHFDLELAASGAAKYAELLRGLRRKLGDGLYVSATIPRSWLASGAAAEVVQAVDTGVFVLYGQRSNELEDPSSWDLTAVRQALRVIEAFGVDYLVGVVTLGRLVHFDGNGTPQAATTVSGSLRSILLDPRFELARGFSLSGVDRQIFNLTAPRGGQVGEWKLAPDEGVQVSRLAAAHIARYYAEIAKETLPHRLGELFMRLPQSGEGLALATASLVNAASGGRPVPDLAIEVLGGQRRARRSEVRLRLSNRNGEESDYSSLDHNWVQLELARGSFGEVRSGSFKRHILATHGARGKLDITFRNPRVLRLYAPLVDGGAVFESGSIEILSDGNPTVTVSSQFLLPDGELYEPPGFVWPGDKP